MGLEGKLQNMGDNCDLKRKRPENIYNTTL